jgi:hypothetical protein
MTTTGKAPDGATKAVDVYEQLEYLRAEYPTTMEQARDLCNRLLICADRIAALSPPEPARGEKCETCSDSGTVFESTVVPEDTEIPCPDCTAPQPSRGCSCGMGDASAGLHADWCAMCIKPAPQPAKEGGELLPLDLAAIEALLTQLEGFTLFESYDNLVKIANLLCPRVREVIAELHRLRTPPAVDDARDAARYRWIRAGHPNADDHIQDYNDHTRVGVELDAAIDSAMKRIADGSTP